MAIIMREARNEFMRSALIVFLHSYVTTCLQLHNYTRCIGSNISINALSCWTFILIISASRIDVQAAVYIKRNRHPKQLNSNQFSLVLFFIFPPLLVIKVSIIHSFFLINSDQVVHRFISFVNLLPIQSTTIAPEYDFISY